MPDFEANFSASDATEAIVHTSQRITPDSSDEVRRIVLRIDTPAFYFLEGQNIGVLTPGPHPYGNKTHHRYYTIANAEKSANGEGVELELLVRRCFYIDEVSGEQYPGEASNYLCDLQPGSTISITGPYRSPFLIPADKNSNLLMLGTGTGIAPFRAFLRRLYQEQSEWVGKVRLFYGARTGAEMLYMNDQNSDLTNYYDQATFQAIQSLSKGVLKDEGDALQSGVEAHSAEIWDMLQDEKTHVYLAGMKKIATAFDASMARLAGSDTQWQAVKQSLIDAKRWSELTYH